MSQFLSEIVERIRNEPVLVTTLVGAVLTALAVFNIPLTEEQIVALVAVATALMAIIARSAVTPVRAPTLPPGTTVAVKGTETTVDIPSDGS
jgi:ABC-type amino acid transport system permease subunit